MSPDKITSNKIDKIGIEYKIFEYTGRRKKEIMDFRAAPGNLQTGLNVMRTKLGITEDVQELKEHVQKHVKNIIEGKSIKKQ